MLVVKDFAANFLAAPISANATGLVVVDASWLPDLSAPGSFCWLVLQSATDRSKVEIVRAVGQSGNTYTIQRGWNTTPVAFDAGDYVEQRITVNTFAYYTEQLVSGLAEAGSGNLLRDGGPVLTALIEALSNAVTLDGAETITGAKTFTGETLYPAVPVAGTEISNKNYVDNAIRSALAAIDWASIVTTNTVQDITAAKVFKANLSVSGAMANFASATAVNVPTPTVRPNAVNKGYFDDWFDANAEASSGLLMRVNGPRDQQIANALANTTGGAYVSASAPPSPFQGMRWFDITVGRTFIYYIDASNHGQWVEENPQSPDWITTSPVLNGIAHETTMLSHRNLLINGGFNVQQRTNDVTLTNTSGPICDRWFMFANNTVRAMVEHGPGARPDGRNVLYLYGSPSNPANNEIALYQRIESRNISHAVGKKVTLQFEAFNGTGKDVTVRAFVDTPGIADDWGSSSTTVEQKIIVTPAKNEHVVYSVTFNNLPESVSRGAALRFHIDVGNSGSYVLSRIQLELGEVATPFEHRPYGYELSLCQRYCYRVSGQAIVGSGACWSNAYIAAQVDLPVAMRAIPSITFSGAFLSSGVAAAAVSSISSVFGTQKISFDAGIAGTSLVGDRYYAVCLNNVAGSHFTFDAEL